MCDFLFLFKGQNQRKMNRSRSKRKRRNLVCFLVAMGSERGNYFRLAELADVGRMKDEDEAPAIDDVPFPAAAAEERLELEPRTLR